MSNTPPLQNMLFAAVDLETTGLDPKQDQIIEIGIQIFDSANMMDQFSMLIDPHLDVGIPAHITDLTGITSDDLEGQPNIESVMSEVTKLLEAKLLSGTILASTWASCPPQGLNSLVARLIHGN